MKRRSEAFHGGPPEAFPYLCLRAMTYLGTPKRVRSVPRCNRGIRRCGPVGSGRLSSESVACAGRRPRRCCLNPSRLRRADNVFVAPVVQVVVPAVFLNLDSVANTLVANVPFAVPAHYLRVVEWVLRRRRDRNRLNIVPPRRQIVNEVARFHGPKPS